MQNYCKTIGALAAASALAAGNATAFEVDYELSTGYTSEYIWRGINLGQDLIETGLNAGTEINGFGLSAGAWYATFQDGGNTTDELDLYTEVSYDFGMLEAAVGYIYYYFPEASEHAQEVPFSLRRDFGLVAADLTYFWDVRADNDGYTQLTLTNETELSSCLTLSSGLATGYLAERGKFSNITLKTALDYALTETATISPFIGYSWALTENPGHGGTMTYVSSKNQIFGGVGLAVSF